MDPSVFATICIDSTNQSALDLICTLISNLSGQPDTFLGSGTLKKMGAKYGVQKAGCEKQGHCYSKREDAAGPLLFVNNMFSKRE